MCDALDLLASFMVFFDFYGLLLTQIANQGLGMDCNTFLYLFALMGPNTTKNVRCVGFVGFVYCIFRFLLFIISSNS